MMNDPFSDEAFMGLSNLTGEELQDDMKFLTDQLEERTKTNIKLRSLSFWRVAAAIVLIAGTISVLFMLLRTPDEEYLTQEIKEKQTQSPEIAVPAVPANRQQNIPEIKEDKSTEVVREPVMSEKKSAGSKSEFTEIVSNKTIEESAEIAIMMAESETNDKSAVQEPAVTDSFIPATGYITGRVLGINRKALSGVSVSEGESGQITSTDMDGNFRLKLSNPESKIELSYTGYQNLEVSSREITGKEISLNEEPKPAQDIIVLGYKDAGTSKSTTPGAAAKSEARRSSMDTYKRPLPPGGSMKEFEKQVESRIDTLRLKELLPGNYKIGVKLTVYKDGKIGNISIPNDVPDIATEEYKKAVSQSERWQPAMSGNLPVDSDIMIEFSLTVK